MTGNVSIRDPELHGIELEHPPSLAQGVRDFPRIEDGLDTHGRQAPQSCMPLCQPRLGMCCRQARSEDRTTEPRDSYLFYMSKLAISIV